MMNALLRVVEIGVMIVGAVTVSVTAMIVAVVIGTANGAVIGMMIGLRAAVVIAVTTVSAVGGALLSFIRQEPGSK